MHDLQSYCKKKSAVRQPLLGEVIIWGTPYIIHLIPTPDREEETDNFVYYVWRPPNFPQIFHFAMIRLNSKTPPG